MRLKLLVIATTLMAYAGPVMAQGVEIHDHSKKKGTIQVGHGSPEATVSGFAPQSGPAGTIVTITGANFTQQTKVKVGGREVRVDSFNSGSLTIRIPEHTYDGVITLRHPGMGNEIQVGTFQLQVEARIRDFNPRSGPVGTRVEINGEGFANGDQVLFNGRPLPISELGTNRIVVVIPQGATSDKFTISRPSMNYARESRQRFEVSMPAPAVSGLSPTQGPPGTQVRITGSYFGADDRVFYGQEQPVAVVARSDSWIDVQVPPNARQSNPFTIRGARGTVQTPVFVLAVNATIARFQPERGGPGTRVDIYGTYFVQGDQVYFNGHPIRIYSLDDQKITVEIPAGASTDRFAIWRNGQAVATAQRPFEIVYAPTISGFQPTQGPSGTHVQISGTGFGRDTRVNYGAQPLNVIGRHGEDQLEVIIPAGAQSQPFTVVSNAGSVNSATAFQVIDYSTILGISPDRGPTGTRVTISIQGGGNNEGFWLNGVALPIVERAPGRYVVQIPAGASTGRLEWESYGRRQASNYTFTVAMPVPTFSPVSGPPGTRVIVSGSGLSASVRVRWGNVWQNVTTRSANSLEFNVEGRPGTDTIYLIDGRDSIKLSPGFTVVAAPTPTFSPQSGPAGTHVVVSGAGFSPAVRVRLGNRFQNITARTGNTLEFNVESDPGTESIYLLDGPDTVRLTPGFTTTTPPPATFSPQSGPVGTHVVIHGYGFSPNARVRLGNTFQNVTARSATTLEFNVDGQPGTNTFYVVDGREAERLNPTFTVIGAPKPAPPPAPYPPPAPPPPPPAPSCTFTAAPVNASAGQTVTIDTNGCNVHTVKQAWFKGVSAQVVSVSPTAVVIRMPPKAAGTDNIAIELDNGTGAAVRVRTSNKITVQGGY